jgi:uncharacterized protein (TIGR00369 family)
MRKKIRNPYEIKGYNCFACSPDNPIGLKMTFEESKESLHAEWVPDVNFQGYINVLHGGIISTLLDEIGVWFINVKLGTSGVTSEIRVKFLKPVYLSSGDITLDATLQEQSERNAKIKCRLFDTDGKLCAEAVSDYFIYPETIARRRLMYPGKEAFYFG